MTTAEVDELNERSKNDRAIIVGSEIRALIQELRNAKAATLFDEVRRYVEADARHRNGFRLSEFGTLAILSHASSEVEELIQAEGQNDDAEALIEFTDVLGCLYHYAIRKGWTSEKIVNVGIAKLATRLTIEPKGKSNA